MEKEPELEARMGDGETDAARVRRAARFVQTRVLVDVEHAPDLIVAEVVIALAARPFRGLVRQLHRGFHRRPGIAAGAPDVYTNRVGALRDAKSFDVLHLCNRTFT